MHGRAARALDLRALRFVLVGVLNTAFGWALFASLLYLGFPYPWAALIGTVLGVLFNFQTSGSLVFADRDRSRFGRFLFAYALVYCASVGPLWLAERGGFNLYVTSAILTPLTATFSYILQKTFVFAEKA